MATEVQIAVAGSGKTAEIARRISAQSQASVSLAVTYTINGQDEIQSRVGQQLSGHTETLGWFSFLLQHIVRPYLPAVFQGVSPSGLCFVQADGQIPRRGGWKYYFNDKHQPYSTRLSLLAKKVLEATGGAPIRRLENIYDELFIDEFQDLVGNDLVVLEALMQSKMSVFVTGDVRQSVLQTSRSDRLNINYRGIQLINWFREKERAGLCSITYSNETSRFNQAIAYFSDQIHDPVLMLPETSSLQSASTGHDGVFLVDEKDLVEYVYSFDPSPTILRYREGSAALPDVEVLNFGVSKGLTRERVLIITTGPIEKWLKQKTLLAAGSAAGFYVAATRAKHSVALLVKNASSLYSKLHPDFTQHVSLWTPPAS